MDYEDDRFHPTAEIDEYDMMNMNELNSFDKGYNKIFINSNVRNKKGKFVKKKIEFYTTGITPGAVIRDAETGIRYPAKVGSYAENDYFKISLSTGICTSKNGSNVLFYLSPYHCSNHLRLNLSDDIKQKWEEKQKR